MRRPSLARRFSMRLFALALLLASAPAVAQFAPFAEGAPLPMEGATEATLPAPVGETDSLASSSLAFSVEHRFEVTGADPFEILVTTASGHPYYRELRVSLMAPHGSQLYASDFLPTEDGYRLIVDEPEAGEWTAFVELTPLVDYTEAEDEAIATPLEPVRYRLQHRTFASGEMEALAEAFSEVETAFDDLHSRVGEALEAADRGEKPDVERALEDGLAGLAEAVGAQNPIVRRSEARFATYMAEESLYRGDRETAQVLYERALAAEEAQWGRGHPRTARALSSLATALLAQEEHGKARPLYEQSFGLLETYCGSYHRLTMDAAAGLIEVLRAQDDLATAAPLLERERVARAARRMDARGRRGTADPRTSWCPADLAAASLAELPDGPPVLYPSIAAPAVVAPEARFDVLISLTETPGEGLAEVAVGETADGGLELRGVGAYEVVLFAPGFEIRSNVQSLEVFERGDSTPARFVLTPEAGTVGPKTLQASLFQEDGAFVAQFSRSVCVGECSEPAEGRREGATSRLAASGGVASGGVASGGVASGGVASGGVASGGVASGGVASGGVAQSYVSPNLTIKLIHGQHADQPRKVQVTITSGVLETVETEWDLPEGAEAWIRTHLSRLAALSARGPQGRPDSSRAFADAAGIGAELWRRYVPGAVKEAFCAQASVSTSRGLHFETIQVVSNDALLPWEIMRPECAGEPRGFLGMEFEIGRLHVDMNRSGVRVRPRQRIEVEGVTLLAPTYEGGDALPAQDAERQALLARTDAVEARATFDGLRALLASPPPHIVHFAGHGQVRTQGESFSQVVLLEGGATLDLIQWQGLVGRTAPPFVFFNACEVGQTDASAGFVSGWATTLLERGTAGYLGALWPVGDKAAADFSEAFYRHLYADTPARGHVAAALRRARRERYEETKDPTHLAYVYYGDPYQWLDLPR